MNPATTNSDIVKLFDKKSVDTVNSIELRAVGSTGKYEVFARRPDKLVQYQKNRNMLEQC